MSLLTLHESKMREKKPLYNLLALSKPRQHHFLSEFYLKGFCPAAELWVYDREKDEHRKLPPEKVAIRKDFYAVEGPNGEKDYAEVERRLGIIEHQAAPAIRKLDAGAKLELRERYALAMLSLS